MFLSCLKAYQNYYGSGDWDIYPTDVQDKAFQVCDLDAYLWPSTSSFIKGILVIPLFTCQKLWNEWEMKWQPENTLWPRMLLSKISFSPIYLCAQTPALLPGAPADTLASHSLDTKDVQPVPALMVIQDWWILFKIQSCSQLIDDFQLFLKTE